MKIHSILLLAITSFLHCASSLDFLYNPINPTSPLLLINDAKLEPPQYSTIRLTQDSNQFSYGRAFHPTPIPITNSTSFSTSFIFSILLSDIYNNPGFGLVFVLSNWTSPPNALASSYLGVFSNATAKTVAPLIAVRFSPGRNPEFNELDVNQVGVNLNYVESEVTREAGYYDSNGTWIPFICGMDRIFRRG